MTTGDDQVTQKNSVESQRHRQSYTTGYHRWIVTKGSAKPPESKSATQRQRDRCTPESIFANRKSKTSDITTATLCFSKVLER
ncbi:hypothetical protein DY000_02064211 [Brassica cretica]|uniref:Uncharacterized protein n=1 Tax=Brassica cretica TaxID=69181 RepID=A0ABQ7APS9_BRACR|nr:hypothetical protein DY000_02064211 [Brassica cretica]